MSKLLNEKDDPASSRPENYVVTKKRICVDLDGVLHKYSKKYHDGTMYDRPVDGAKEFMTELKRNGYCIYVHTSRPMASENYSDCIEDIAKWLKKWKIPYDHITSLKIPANAYIDDRAVRFNGNWNDVIDGIREIETINNDSENGDWGYYHKSIK